MKKVLATLIILWVFSNQLYSQYATRFENFLSDKGVREFADLAHPTNTFKSGTWDIDGDDVYINIEYEDNYRTSLRIERSGGWFVKIHVVSDNDFFPPFKAIETLKDMIMSLTKNDKEEAEKVDEFEKYLRKTFEEMSGKELACLDASLEWFKY